MLNIYQDREELCNLSCLKALNVNHLLRKWWISQTVYHNSNLKKSGWLEIICDLKLFHFERENSEQQRDEYDMNMLLH